MTEIGMFLRVNAEDSRADGKQRVSSIAASSIPLSGGRFKFATTNAASLRESAYISSQTDCCPDVPAHPQDGSRLRRN
ncbi:hypothetical protein SAMN05443661_10480 [Natronobacterium gregoryi]|uniref:Uncharacterized protein n=2 Tax=Natronobacterium gregoryi TaxID=44930 RepID=L0AHN7_NATGS|nr:hypothetical protein Natgr_2246 [Natronobacterium gregoryi SP2]ELY68619.1 hypothetical protein C490_09378 [Natronobacterium gregoryi SP2]PLK18485.1 hypothetical protein CYV19_17635 [Natronobacterium gregoryi SP2]SFI72340.1 hypothetical protein SAMN05443661_10480 [Natronobacterium gregoryi]